MAEDLSKYTIDASGVAPAQKQAKEMEVNDVKLKEKIDLNEIPLEKRNLQMYIAGIIIFVLVIISTIGIFYARTRQETISADEKGSKSDQTAATQTPEASASTDVKNGQLERSEISLEILNGSGISGEAGKVAGVFEKLGYVIKKTGNAEPTEGNKLLINQDMEAKLEVLLGDVEKELDIASRSGYLRDSTVSARIILGK